MNQNISNLQNGEIFYRHGDKVWGPIEVTNDKFLVHFHEAAHTSKFPKTDVGLLGAIVDAQKNYHCQSNDLKDLFKVHPGVVCKL